jgi:hypothetical protein
MDTFFFFFDTGTVLLLNHNSACLGPGHITLLILCAIATASAIAIQFMDMKIGCEDVMICANKEICGEINHGPALAQRSIGQQVMF